MRVEAVAAPVPPCVTTPVPRWWGVGEQSALAFPPHPVQVGALCSIPGKRAAPRLPYPRGKEPPSSYRTPGGSPPGGGARPGSGTRLPVPVPPSGSPAWAGVRPGPASAASCTGITGCKVTGADLRGDPRAEEASPQLHLPLN